MASITSSNALGGTTWLSRVKANPGSRLRLFCFPYAGGGASTFRAWGQNLPETVDVFPVQLPGRENRVSEPPFTELSLLVKAAAQVLLPYLDMPFAFFGHSMGAMISFELARELRRLRGPLPVHLFLSGRRAAQLPLNTPPTYNAPDQEFFEELRRLNGTPSEVFEQAELRQLVIPLLRADFEVCETYQYSSEPPLDCFITALGGLHDPEVSLQDLQAWRKQTTSSFSLKMFAGDHFFLHAVQDQLLRALSTELHSSVQAAHLHHQ